MVGDWMWVQPGTLCSEKARRRWGPVANTPPSLTPAHPNYLPLLRPPFFLSSPSAPVPIPCLPPSLLETRGGLQPWGAHLPNSVRLEGGRTCWKRVPHSLSGSSARDPPLSSWGGGGRYSASTGCRWMRTYEEAEAGLPRRESVTSASGTHPRTFTPSQPPSCPISLHFE